jgi:hypothetical protein
MSNFKPVDEDENPELSLFDLVDDWYFPDTNGEDEDDEMTKKLRNKE